MTAPRKTARDFHPKILEIFDGYVHGRVTKREFLAQAGRYTAAGVTGAMLLEQLSPNYAFAQQVDPEDSEIETMRISYPSPDGTAEMIDGLMAKPAGASGPLPAILVVHENRGLNPYIEDVVRRAAKAGYLALGPDGLSSLGGYPGTDEEGREMQRELDGGALMQDFFNAFEFLRDHEDSTGRVGVVGFCYGGGVCNALAVAYPDLAASAPFYGRQPEASEVPAIQAPLMIHYAGLDERINEGWAPYAEALEENGKQFSVHFYPDVNHGFHNDTTPRYDEDAALLAWERTINFFDEFVAQTA
ncbi:Carboxymethylenebutenolidase [Rhodobacteraceae bacterium THAF1]|uniref:YghX family hydrolase n=1 Tax=Palleronia sp. THAF1 TaxID=2587842 RepID=UPI000F40F0B0|nr:YghX family hydrolase [Palleronia sp. THAF1]QFU08458.1 Carboxymethylenebutenolidase [Palleronia sp. THAF1]VDC29352.1 Carboxymethylenebutenolidase [Rhodobacteraceae bacterium THAF1]